MVCYFRWHLKVALFLGFCLTNQLFPNQMFEITLALCGSASRVHVRMPDLPIFNHWNISSLSKLQKLEYKFLAYLLFLYFATQCSYTKGILSILCGISMKNFKSCAMMSWRHIKNWTALAMSHLLKLIVQLCITRHMNIFQRKPIVCGVCSCSLIEPSMFPIKNLRIFMESKLGIVFISMHDKLMFGSPYIYPLYLNSSPYSSIEILKFWNIVISYLFLTRNRSLYGKFLHLAVS